MYCSQEDMVACVCISVFKSLLLIWLVSKSASLYAYLCLSLSPQGYESLSVTVDK